MLGLSDGLEAPSPRDTACVMALAECNGASPQRCIRSGEPDQALLLYAEGGRALEHAAQGGRGISLFGDTPNPPGRDPEPPAPADPAWPGGLDAMISRGPVQPQQFRDG